MPQMCSIISVAYTVDCTLQTNPHSVPVGRLNYGLIEQWVEVLPANEANTRSHFGRAEVVTRVAVESAASVAHLKDICRQI